MFALTRASSVRFFGGRLARFSFVLRHPVEELESQASTDEG
jgi:hypothetical protein